MSSGLIQINWQPYILNPQFFGLVVSGIVAVLLTYFIQSLKETRTKSEMKKSHATLLGYEIESIRQQAGLVRETGNIVLPQVQTLERNIEITQRFMRFQLAIRDADYPSYTYDRPNLSLELFDLETAASISELYRWCKFEDQLKNQINQLESQVNESTSITEARGSFAASPGWRAKSLLLVRSVRSYYDSSTRIQELAAESLKHLEKVAKIDKTKVKILQQTRFTNQTPPVQRPEFTPATSSSDAREGQ